MELSRGGGVKSFVAIVETAVLGNTTSSPAMGTPPSQFAGLLHLPSLAAPVQVRVAPNATGASSTRATTAAFMCASYSRKLHTHAQDTPHVESGRDGPGRTGRSA